MEKKKLYRVAGILILVALVIVILPLLTGKNDLPFNRTLSVEAPPFPGSASGSTPETSSQPEHTAPTPVAPRLPEVIKHPTATENIKSGPAADTISGSTALANSANKDEPTYPVNPASNEQPAIVMPSSSDTTVGSNQKQNLSHNQAQEAGSSEQTTAQHEKLTAKKTSTQPGHSVWAVQMGHFHIHRNAVRLANQLRSLGFKAYTRQIVSKTGHVSTRVYVGPEVTEASAQKLTARIHEQMKLTGIVVPVEPLAI